MTDLIAVVCVSMALHLCLFVRLVLHLVWSALLPDGTLFMGLVCAAPDLFGRVFVASVKLFNHSSYSPSSLRL